jgi:integrase/recombinase XerD
MTTKVYIDAEQVKLMEEAAEYLRDKLLIRLLFRLGCRISEALGIGVEDIDFDRGVVTIEHLKVRINFSCPGCGAKLGRNHRFCPGCGLKVGKAVTRAGEHRRRRTLPVDDDTLATLRDYIAGGGPVSHDDKQSLFGITRGHAWRIITELAGKADLGVLVNPETGKVRKISPHRLRDAFAVHAVKLNDSGDGLRLLQEQLGHQSITTTMRYRKISGEEQREWYEKLWNKEPL